MRVLVLAIALLASSSLCPAFAQETGNLRLQRRKRLLCSRTRTPSDSRVNASSVINLETVRWIATGGCVAGIATAWAGKTAKWIRTGECTATAMTIAIATKIAAGTATEPKTAPTEPARYVRA